MALLDSLPGDQRAVLQLVLGRGRSYGEIARLLSINPVAVRERALAALDALGPQTKVDSEHRGMIADYLLRQLPEGDVAEVRRRLADSPSERAWARVLSSELAPLASEPLPEIPVSGDSAEPEAAPAEAALPDSQPTPSSPASAPDTPAADSPRRGRGRRGGEETEAAGAAAGGAGAGGAAAGGTAEPGTAAAADAPRSSRLGGAVLIGVAVVIVAVVLIVVLSGGSSKHPVASAPAGSSTPAAASSTAASSTASGSATSTSSTAAKVIAQINLTPTAAGSKTAGIAEVLQEGTSNGIAIVAQNVPPNSKSPPNAYAVWLYNSPSDAHILGFVNPSVGSNGRLSTAGGLPANASHYKELIVTVETAASPKTPGQIILQGTLKGL